MQRVKIKLKHKVVKTAHRLKHEFALAALIVLADGIIKAIMEADWTTGAVKSVAIVAITALGLTE